MPKFLVIPQRSNGKAYIDCEPHRATGWSVQKLITTCGRTTKTVLSRHATRTIADGVALSHKLSHAGPLRNYKLGKRMTPKEI